MKKQEISVIYLVVSCDEGQVRYVQSARFGILLLVKDLMLIGRVQVLSTVLISLI